ncbi:putative colanic acid biosynthesis acetyltransferase [Olleya sp. Ti.3.14]|uniref:putative colanic acid biosynthesis acetyltransferase n=1 Tax=Olleya sp. Ti.3.14 TaxID=3121297 RepID=UPI00311D4282
MSNIEIEKYKDNITLKNKISRKIWFVFYCLLFRPFSGRMFIKWRNLILKIFGAKIGVGSIVYASAKILAPWNLEIGKETCIGPNVKFHIGKTIIGSKVTISQGSYLCTGSHEVSSISVPFISKAIVIQDFAWVAAECFIMMGVTIGEGAVVGARSSVFKNVDDWSIVGGNPAQFIKKRIINEH